MAAVCARWPGRIDESTGCDRSRWEESRQAGLATCNCQALAGYRLVATASTARLLCEKVGLEVEAVQPGPLGGDAQIGARVVEGQVDGVIFLVDPLDKHPHDPDIQALMRLCNVHNVPLATNVATADSIIVWMASHVPETPLPHL